MVSTRSKTAQTHLEDFATTKSTTSQKTPKSNTEKHSDAETSTQHSPSKKRKAPITKAEDVKSKRAKTSGVNNSTHSAETEDTSTILINRAPVLQLWSACVAHHLYPSLPWSTCISAGSAISAICAVAKGRSIGTVPGADESEEKNRKRAEAKKKQGDLDEIHVMHFNLKLKDGLAIVGTEEKGKPANEDALTKKFGDQEYKRTRKCFEEALATWNENDEERLDKEAFHFYEMFRPTVSSGQKGWGMKGALNLETIKNVVQNK
ncbi:uncharacterized protein CC84DRAFT_1220455 [Paraphaeosphaeria sporulosa]|uniref:Uncharacterized protein n=1 Tax=Paraphaeosphaeria sporulosa TaxID=1460663 RepID=A0A177C5X8_9PLEO|nr:uncharacterized protein CC84DRAFT_1220455 [Paraphaeosphaeria sporulosa]OAG02090.1 hypothetical protein CC84DRAFT_1220455 [Paraphaeosphaeria sporulosa]